MGSSRNVSGRAEERSASSRDPAIEVAGLSKRFGAQVALADVGVAFRRGTITALLGQNGSGKSTLVKALAGVQEPDEGTVRVWGEDVPLRALTPGFAKANGMHFLHQDLGLVDDLSVVENIGFANGFDTAAGGRIRWRQMSRDVERQLANYGLSINVNAPVGRLSAVERTLVGIARACATETGSLGPRSIHVFDEPTAALPDEERERLFSVIRQTRDAGACVIYVTHRLDEVFEICDEVVVLRDGRVVLEGSVAETKDGELIRAIAGRHVHDFERSALEPPGGEVVLGVNRLCGGKVSDVSFDLRAGEILGVAGLLASGRSELLRMIAGAQIPAAGRVIVEGRELAPHAPATAIKRHIAYLPEGRATEGSIPSLSVRSNLTLPSLRAFWARGWLSDRAERAEARRRMCELAVSPDDPELSLSSLSGGNQQKVILAKWLRLEPRVVLLDEPTQGIDVHTKAEIFRIIRERAESGVATILVSSDFTDLAANCHRVLVLNRGRMVGELGSDEVSKSRLTDLCFQSAPQGGAGVEEPVGP